MVILSGCAAAQTRVFRARAVIGLSRDPGYVWPRAR